MRPPQQAPGDARCLVAAPRSPRQPRAGASAWCRRERPRPRCPLQCSSPLSATSARRRFALLLLRFECICFPSSLEKCPYGKEKKQKKRASLSQTPSGRDYHCAAWRAALYFVVSGLHQGLTQHNSSGNVPAVGPDGLPIMIGASARQEPGFRGHPAPGSWRKPRVPSHCYDDAAQFREAVFSGVSPERVR